MSSARASNGFSIIIPTYNRAELLQIALNSVQQLEVPEGWRAEILVVDNNSTDLTPQIAQDAHHTGPIPVRHVLETKQGLCHARNCGIRNVAFEHLIYLDDDMQVDPGWLDGYLKARELFHADCVVGPVDPWFEVDPEDWVTPHILESVTSAYSHKGEQIHIVPPESAHEIPGCNFAVLRSVACEVGGFPPILGRTGTSMLAGEDWEFGEKLGQLGRSVVYAPGCRIRHFISRKKLSREGLRQRWQGLGATDRAMMRLRGDDLSLRRRVRLTARMSRFFLRSRRCRLLNKHGEAFNWELEARKLYGFLLKSPSGIKPRRWPPEPLVIADERATSLFAADARPTSSQ